jgi:hypothetical protein
MARTPLRNKMAIDEQQPNKSRFSYVVSAILIIAAVCDIAAFFYDKGIMHWLWEWLQGMFVGSCSGPLTFIERIKCDIENLDRGG